MTQAHERTATLSQLVGKRIKLKLFLAEMSGRDLAIKLGVSPSWVSYRVSGKQEIGLDDLYRIAKALDVEVTELLTPEAVAGAAGPQDIPRYLDLAVRSETASPLPRDNRPPGGPRNTHPSSPARTAYVSRRPRGRRD